MLNLKTPLMFVLLLPSTISATSSNYEVVTEFPMEVETVDIIPENVIDLSELECLATNIYFEARGEPLSGQIAVAQVTMNRVRSYRFPDSICDVVYQARLNSRGNPIRHQCQFSWYCDGKLEIIGDRRKYDDILRVAADFLRNEDQFIDLVGGAEYYHSTKVSPHWASVYIQTASISDHIFYRRH